MAVLSSSLSLSVVGPCGPSREMAAVSCGDWAVAKEGVSKKKMKEKDYETYDMMRAAVRGMMWHVRVASMCPVLLCVITIMAIGCRCSCKAARGTMWCAGGVDMSCPHHVLSPSSPSVVGHGGPSREREANRKGGSRINRGVHGPLP
jgi:hypothetical protein